MSDVLFVMTKTVRIHLTRYHFTCRLALDLAAQKNVTLPTTSAANQQYVTAIEHGLGDQDFSAVYKDLSGGN